MSLSVHERFPLSTLLYYHIGGMARYLLEAHSAEEIGQALVFVRERGIERLIVVGLGANLLFPDGEFNGAVLRVSAGVESQIVDLGLVAAGEPGADGGHGLARLAAFAGESLDDVIQHGFAAGYVGLEWAGGLPGTVGAAVRGNVGAFGGEIKDVLASADVIDLDDPDLAVRRLTNGELGFRYRESLVKRSGRLVVVSAVFRLPAVGPEALAQARASCQANIDYRQTRHPMDYPTCGSVFKNVARPEDVARILAVWPDIRDQVLGRWHGKVSVGFIVGRLGLAGYQIGDAQISLKHNNFIVNLGAARFTDVVGLIEKVRAECEAVFGFAPEPEVEIVRA